MTGNKIKRIKIKEERSWNEKREKRNHLINSNKNSNLLSSLKIYSPITYTETQTQDQRVYKCLTIEPLGLSLTHINTEINLSQEFKTKVQIKGMTKILKNDSNPGPQAKHTKHVTTEEYTYLVRI